MDVMGDLMNRTKRTKGCIEVARKINEVIND